jgi:hypothetical protein
MTEKETCSKVYVSDNSVEKNEPKYNKGHIAGRTLRMPGLKPSDYFLFKEARAYFQYDMRQLFTLGLRLIYILMHNPGLREQILIPLSGEIANEDLDIQKEKVVYVEFSKIGIER